MLELLTINHAERVDWCPWHLSDETIPAVTIRTSKTLFTVALESVRVETRKTSARLYILNTASTGRKTKKGALCRLNSAGVATLAAAGVKIEVTS